MAEIISEVHEAVAVVDKPPDATELRKQQLKVSVDRVFCFFLKIPGLL